MDSIRSADTTHHPDEDAKTLRDVLPREFFIEFMDTPAARLLDVPVSRVRESGWPGAHKYVFVWWELADGHAVAWNENPSRGWSFPVLRTHADEDRAVLLPSPAPKPDAKTTQTPRPGALDWKLTETRLPGRRMRFETRCGPFTI